MAKHQFCNKECIVDEVDEAVGGQDHVSVICKVYITSTNTGTAIANVLKALLFGRQKHFLQTAYHQIWPPLTYAEVKCFTAETVW